MLVARERVKKETIMRKYVIIIALLTAAACHAQDSLQTYIQAALRENPEVMAKWHAYEAAIEAVCPAGTLGDPELSLNIYPKPMTQVNGRQVMSVSLMQMFPWGYEVRQT